MVLDSSALVAILLNEPDAQAYADAVARAPLRMMSAVTRVELAIVIESRKGAAGRRDLERLLREADVEVVSVTAAQAERAIDAFRRFGRGRHRARLNIGDCFAYALAAEQDLPLLFKGDDFGHTDIRLALAG